jgi:hypothetical protein
MTKPGLGRLFVAEQLQRYFVAAIGFAVAALWSFAGSASGLTCLLVAGVCYGVTAIFQRGLLGRIVETAKQEHTRLRSSPSAARARRAPEPISARDECALVRSWLLEPWATASRRAKNRP